MNWKRIAKELIGGAKQAKFPKPISPKPITPEPAYICQNCGMLIETGHGHSRTECETYFSNPTKPDKSLRRAMKERPGRNDPKVKLPYYQSSEQKVNENV